MRTLAKNQMSMKYSLNMGKQPVYELDEYGQPIIEFIDEEGNIYYKETGDYATTWSEPVIFYGNIAQSGGEAEAREFGLSVADYDATIVMEKNKVPLKEGSLIWLKSEVSYEDDNNTRLDEKSADFTVIRVSESLNFVKHLLKAVIK